MRSHSQSEIRHPSSRSNETHLNLLVALVRRPAEQEIRARLHNTFRDTPSVFAATDAEWRGRDASLEVLVGATFGGDEVIVAAAGGSYAEFIRAVARLRDLLAESTPRTCSFAVASTGVISASSVSRGRRTSTRQPGGSRALRQQG